MTDSCRHSSAADAPTYDSTGALGTAHEERHIMVVGVQLMRYTSELTGRRIVSAATGRHLGVVTDVCLDERCARVVALVVRPRWFSAEKILPYAALAAVGTDAIVARSTAAMEEAAAWDRHGAHGPRGSSLGTVRVMTAEGHQLGTLGDVRVDERTGAVTGYDMVAAEADGRVAQHAFIPRSTNMTIGPGSIILSERIGRALLPLCSGRHSDTARNREH